MTLAEFLEARISERESLARDLRHQAYSGPSPLLSHGGGTLLRDLVDPERMLAECAAKRAIVALLAPELGRGYSSSDTAAEMLALLASVYADHPDYDPMWRP